jgi:dienelactone hydrolase
MGQPLLTLMDSRNLTLQDPANHGFHNDTNPRYDEAAAKEAWQRTLNWFNKYLRG